MADYDLSTISGALSVDFADPVQKTANRASKLLKLFPVVEGGGSAINWDVENDGAYAEQHSDGADVSTYGSDVPAKATLPWGTYRANVKITDLANSAAMSSRSPAGLMRPVAKNLLNGTAKLASSINAVGYSGAGTTGIIAGLANAIDDTNTYAGINRTTYSYFRSKVVDPGSSTAVTIALIRSDLSAVEDQCGESPDIALCSTAVWNAVANLFTESERRVRAVQRGALEMPSGRIIQMDATVNAIMVDDCMFVKDKDCTANVIYYLNSSAVEWRYLPVYDDEMSDVIARMQMQDAVAGTGTGSQLPFGMVVIPIARTGSARKLMMPVQLQLCVLNPKMCGVRKNVAA